MTRDFKRTYTGDARILVQIGDEYVYQPITGAPGQAGMTITADTIALNEVGIIKNAEIIEQVFGEMTSPTSPYASRFDPEGMKKLNAAWKLRLKCTVEWTGLLWSLRVLSRLSLI